MATVSTVANNGDRSNGIGVAPTCISEILRASTQVGG